MIESFAKRDSVQLPPSRLLKNNRLLTDQLASSAIIYHLPGCSQRFYSSAYTLKKGPCLQFTSVCYFSLMNCGNKTDETHWVAEPTAAANLLTSGRPT
jgi:hypothetical protein